MSQDRPKKIPTEIELKFGERIKQLRQERSWTQEDLAAKMEIEASNLRKYELGSQGITLLYLQRMAEAFGISLNELMDF